jgi:excisionase family DNA binding protein
MLRVSSGSVYRWVKAGRLPHFRTPGNQLRFRRADVEKLMAPETGTDKAGAA